MFCIGLVSNGDGNPLRVVPQHQIQLGGEPQDGRSLAYASEEVLEPGQVDGESPGLVLFDLQMGSGRIEAAKALILSRLGRQLDQVDYTAPLPAAVFWNQGRSIPVWDIYRQCEVKHGAVFEVAFEFQNHELRKFPGLLCGPSRVVALSPIAGSPASVQDDS